MHIRNSLGRRVGDCPGTMAERELSPEQTLHKCWEQEGAGWGEGMKERGKARCITQVQTEVELARVPKFRQAEGGEAP